MSGHVLYYRFKGVPLDRLGGAWWHRSFESHAHLTSVRITLTPFIEEFIEEPDHGCCEDWRCPFQHPGTYQKKEAI